MSEGKGWALGGLHDVLQNSYEKRVEQIKEITKKLGKADMQLGILHFWRIEGGVVCYRYHPNGQVDIYSRFEYSDEFIGHLIELIQRPARTFE